MLPCGAGKTLVGITAMSTVKKSTLIFCTTGVVVQQWREQVRHFTQLGPDYIYMFTADVKHKPTKDVCVMITTYNMVAIEPTRRSAQAQDIMEFITKHEWLVGAWLDWIRILAGFRTSLADECIVMVAVGCKCISPQINPIQSNPIQSNPIQSNPIQFNSIQSNPIQSNPTQSNPIQPNPIQPNPIQPNPIQPNPIQPNPIQSNPIQSNPIQSNPIQSNPINQPTNTNRGLVILDEVQVAPADMFRRCMSITHSKCKLGLTATLVREDDKINDLFFLIGPKLYEANWLDLQQAGHIATVQCLEVWCEMTPEFYDSYLQANTK